MFPCSAGERRIRSRPMPRETPANANDAKALRRDREAGKERRVQKERPERCPRSQAASAAPPRRPLAEPGPTPLGGSPPRRDRRRHPPAFRQEPRRVWEEHSTKVAVVPCPSPFHWVKSRRVRMPSNRAPLALRKR